MTVKPEELKKVERSKQNLSIYFGDKKLSFKFSNAEEAKKW